MLTHTTTCDHPSTARSARSTRAWGGPARLDRCGRLAVDPTAVRTGRGGITAVPERLRALRAAGVSTVVVPVPATSVVDGGPALPPRDAVRGIDLLVAADASAGPEPSAAELVRALRRGCAVLTCAVGDEGLLVGVEAALRHVGRAHRATGAPVLVRTSAALMTGLDAAHVLEEEDVDPFRVMLTGCGDTADRAHLAELAGWGYRLGVDRSPGSAVTDETRLDVVADLCRAGFGRSTAMVHDAHADDRGFTDAARLLRRRDVSPIDTGHVLGGTGRRWLAGSRRR
jgi:hypothetical protein